MALTPEEARELARLERLADWLDTKYETPVGIRVGWDGIIGLVPVVGEFVTTLISGYVILRAAWFGASMPVLLRMGLNVLIDDAIGIVPVFGWIGDFVWKSNVKNTDLLRRHLSDPETTRRRSLAVLIAAAAIVVAVLMAAAFLAFLALVFVWRIVRDATQEF